MKYKQIPTGRFADLVSDQLKESIFRGRYQPGQRKEDVGKLTEALEDMPEAPGDEYVAWNVNFHRLLARCSHNPMFTILVNILLDFTEELIIKIKPTERVIHDSSSHPELLEKVRRGDSDGARRKMRSHLEDVVPLPTELEKKASAISPN